jgi:hypothetical protein
MADTGYISPAQRDILIEHIDGQPVLLGAAGRAKERPIQPAPIQRHSINSLIKRGMLKAEKVSRWRIETTITDKGREVLAKALAEYADALIRAKLAGAFVQEQFTGFNGILERFSGLPAERPPAAPDK